MLAQVWEDVPLIEPPIETPVKRIEKKTARKAMNSTAYRIFKLLQWLIQSPLSVEALNRLFCEDPLIGKPVSNDTVWLYVNTLRALGCKIRRPSPRNNFQYEMLSHPFGIALSDAQFETLSQAKAYAQQQFTHQEMMVLDGLLRKIVGFSTVEDPQQAVDRLFAQSRSFDYQGRESHIESLEHWIEAEQLLWITYVSPLKGQEQFYFLPEAVYYEQGVVYVRGERPENPGPSSLRIERLLQMQPVTQEALWSTLKQRKAETTEVILHLRTQESMQFQGFGLDENHGVYEESCQPIGHESSAFGYEVRLRVRDWFYLKQRLLASGLSFCVVTPDAFRQEMHSTLQAMLAFYKTKGDKSNGHG